MTEDDGAYIRERIGKLEGEMSQVTKAIDNFTTAVNKLTEAVGHLHTDNSVQRAEIKSMARRLAKIEPKVEGNLVAAEQLKAADKEEEEGAAARRSLFAVIISGAALLISLIVNFFKGGPQ